MSHTKNGYLGKYSTNESEVFFGAINHRHDYAVKILKNNIYFFLNNNLLILSIAQKYGHIFRFFFGKSN